MSEGRPEKSSPLQRALTDGRIVGMTVQSRLWENLRTSEAVLLVHAPKSVEQHTNKFSIFISKSFEGHPVRRSGGRPHDQCCLEFNKSQRGSSKGNWIVQDLENYRGRRNVVLPNQ